MLAHPIDKIVTTKKKRPAHPYRCAGRYNLKPVFLLYSFTAVLKSSALSVFSQENSTRSRPKCP
jgi:hypothetical protein